MSGVIDGKGQQWEHCGKCHEFVRFPQNLGYQKPNNQYKYGRDLCIKCTDDGIQSGEIKFEEIIPAPSWEILEGD